MSNLITCERADGAPSLQLSNGSMSVLISVLLLAGSDLAESLWERELVVWLAEHDQGIYGGGVVGFDLDEIAWSPGDLAAQRAFLLRVIDLARARHRWDVLDYDPPFVADQLLQLRAMVERYPEAAVAEGRAWQWWGDPPTGERCPRHDVLLHAGGCAICNDG
jgi:hypothetical protein